MSLLVRPRGATHLLVLAHGAGAGMRHGFLEQLAAALAAERIATWRYEFPYMAAGRRFPDRPAVAEAAVRDAWAAARRATKLPAFAGGKSFGGRMTSQAHAGDALPDVRGLVFAGFPLHPPVVRRAPQPAGALQPRPGITRAAHLPHAAGPLLFLQGTRDELAPLRRLRSVLAGLGERATLHVVRGADHAFAVRGRGAAEVLAELAAATAAWMRRVAP